MTNRGLELNERMRLVVRICRARLAVGAEISIVAHSTLVSLADDIGDASAAGSTKRSIAADANVRSGNTARRAGHSASNGNRLVDRHEPMALVNEISIQDTVGAVVPVWTIEALVSNSPDVLFLQLAGALHMKY